MGPDVVTSVAGLNYFRTALSAGSPRHETADQSRFLPLGLAMLYDGTAGLTLITLCVICYGEHKFITFSQNALPAMSLSQNAITVCNNYRSLICFYNLLPASYITFDYILCATLFGKYKLSRTYSEAWFCWGLTLIVFDLLRFTVLYIALRTS